MLGHRYNRNGFSKAIIPLTNLFTMNVQQKSNINTNDNNNNNNNNC